MAVVLSFAYIISIGETIYANLIDYFLEYEKQVI